MEKQTILIVDDNEINRQILSELLCDEYDIMEAANGLEALELINMNISSLSLILLDIMMPELDGIEVLKILKRDVSTLTVPVIFITAAESNEHSGLQLGAVDFITKPFDPDIVKTRVDTHIRLKNYRDQLEALLAYNTVATAELWTNTFETLASVCEYRDARSVANTKRMDQLTQFMFKKIIAIEGNELMYFDDDLEALQRAATILDIGKIRIPEAILFKPDKLTDAEFEQMKKHTTYGVEIVEQFYNGSNEKYVSYCKDACAYHHEKWDGTGYPAGLSYEQIPHHVRVLSLIHVYNALISEKPYRPAFSHNDALEMIEAESGQYFDPEIVHVFLTNQDKIRTISLSV